MAEETSAGDVRELALGRVTESELEVSDLRVRFGGLVAVDGVSIRAHSGKITGLIGPNGAGKTTIFNACSGLNRPNTGVVRFGANDVSRKGPAARARLGLGRTFQQVELFETLTVWQNVALGCEGGDAGLNPLRHIASSPRRQREVRDATNAALRVCHLDAIAERVVSSLPTGHRRLVELARCLAGPFSVLLLDEPSSGLDREETTELGEILQHVVHERGVGVLLVEHDMTLVTAICDYIYVVDFGKPIFEGTGTEVMVSSSVRAAYLGDRYPAGSDSPVSMASPPESGQ